MTVFQATPDNIARAAGVLRAGGLVGMPTETVYGLAADALNPAAVGGIFAAKGRPADHPLIVHLPSADHLPHWASAIPKDAIALANAFWPGPLTLILRRAIRSRWHCSAPSTPASPPPAPTASAVSAPPPRST
jgi:L-threonylcarbamoyladenylate synthase